MSNIDRQEEIQKVKRDLKRDLKEAGLTAPKHFVDDLSVTISMKREMERNWAEGQEIDLETYNRLSNSCIRGLQSLGLLRGRTDGNGPKRSKSSSPADIGEYLNGKTH